MGNAAKVGIFGVALFGAIAVIGLPRADDEEQAESTAEAPARNDAPDMMEVISMGEEVDIDAHLQAGTTTLIEFTAEW